MGSCDPFLPDAADQGFGGMGQSLKARQVQKPAGSLDRVQKPENVGDGVRI